ncbi:eukaryotic translation initiation factor 2D isoform X2 [Megalopta genalis]|uniref:eukaryotic translation initiation factor 2D isoform X2 n=1 Tax=Megalopta genalis TaxID=115081 RepID=UPI003FD686D9
MFIKPFKIKSNNQLKGTERKKLCQDILAAYPILTDEDVQSLIPKKEAISVMKITTHSGHLGKLYCVAKIPMFFQVDNIHHPLLPTIYSLWHHPNLLTIFTTRHPVISKLASGADLMLPGVVVKEPVTLYSFGKLPKGTPVSVDTDDNKASVAVGITALSSEDMYMSGGYGKCIEILHAIGDTLCQLGKPPARPNMGPSLTTDVDKLENAEQDTDQANKSNDNSLVDTMNDLRVSEENLAHESAGEENAEDNAEESADTEIVVLEEPVETSEAALDPVQEMDNLLEYCFLKACKRSVKSSDLPMLVSNFFKNHLMAACPPDKNIDIKKSRYKKLSVFLAEMKARGVINTSITKGVESLLSIKFDHASIRRLVILEEPAPVEPVVSNTAVVSECYKVTADVVPILSKFGYEKGDVMKRAEIRKCFTEYVKNENLQDGKYHENQSGPGHRHDGGRNKQIHRAYDAHARSYASREQAVAHGQVGAHRYEGYGSFRWEKGDAGK